MQKGCDYSLFKGVYVMVGAFGNVAVATRQCSLSRQLNCIIQTPDNPPLVFRTYVRKICWNVFPYLIAGPFSTRSAFLRNLEWGAVEQSLEKREAWARTLKRTDLSCNLPTQSTKADGQRERPSDEKEGKHKKEKVKWKKEIGCYCTTCPVRWTTRKFSDQHPTNCCCHLFAAQESAALLSGFVYGSDS